MTKAKVKKSVQKAFIRTVMERSKFHIFHIMNLKCNNFVYQIDRNPQKMGNCWNKLFFNIRRWVKSRDECKMENNYSGRNNIFLREAAT